MSVTVIVLAILLIILLYVLYLYLSPATTSLMTSASLLASNPPITTIAAPISPRYAYGLWLYVNTWSNTSDKIIFYRNNNIKLYLDKTQLNLYLDIYMNNGKWFSDRSNNGSPIKITDNFPIQKWCYIVVSVDTTFIDCYLDGKLVLSQKTFITLSDGTAVSPAQPPDVGTSAGSANIVLGGTDVGGSTTQPSYTLYDAAINNFTRWITPVNPQIVWNGYVTGNGSNLNILPKLSSFNANLNILKNNAQYSTFSLF